MKRFLPALLLVALLLSAAAVPAFAASMVNPAPAGSSSTQSTTTQNSYAQNSAAGSASVSGGASAGTAAGSANAASSDSASWFASSLIPTEVQSLLGSLTDTLGSVSTESLLNGLKQFFGDTASMTDEQLRQQILTVAKRCGLTLSDTQVTQVISLLRSLEGFDSGSISSMVSSIQDTLNKISQTAEKAVSLWQRICSWIASVQEFFRHVGEVLGLD